MTLTFILSQTVNHWGGPGKLHGPFDPSSLYLDRDIDSKDKGGKGQYRLIKVPKVVILKNVSRDSMSADYNLS